MPRPKKWRKVCCLPKQNRFGPLEVGPSCNGFISMTIDEYETIRLIDLEGMKQEECADKMNIARTTVQSIYGDARHKIAQSIVNGKVLHIEGGDYELCNGNGIKCGGHGCCKFNQCNENEE